MSALPRYLNRDLLAAAESDDLDGVKSLTAKTEQTPWTKLLCAATSNGSTAVAEYCLQSGARVDDEVMSWVMNSRASEPVYRLLIERKAIVIDFVIDRMGTMLGVCAVHGRDSMARFALEHGANPDRSVDCCMGRSPLACAAMYSHKSTIELLLDHGAKVKGSGALVVAAERGDLECARHLIARGADLNEIGVLTDPERSAAQAGTALHKAVRGEHLEIIELLLACGADTSVCDVRGDTAAALAEDQNMAARLIARLRS